MPSRSARVRQRAQRYSRTLHARRLVGEQLEQRSMLAVTAQLLADINQNPAGIQVLGRTGIEAVGNTAFFRGIDETGSTGLWKSDGTKTGTVLVKNVAPLEFGNANGTVFFPANSLTGPGYDLWKSDGTTAGTVIVKHFDSATFEAPRNFVNVNGALFFQASDGVNGQELWKTDGTTAGTLLVKDINLGAGNSSPVYLANINGRLLFTANDGTNGNELWKSDGTTAGTVLVKDIVPGPASSRPYEFTNVGGTTFFSTLTGGLWKTDGTPVGTVPVKENISPRYLTELNGALLFAASDDLTGVELWKSDGTTAGTTIVKNIQPDRLSSSPTSLANVGGTLFFAASAPGIPESSELWKSDGTESGTVRLRQFGGIRAGVFEIIGVNSKAYFIGREGYSEGIWKSDGTVNGTVLVTNSGGAYLTNVNGKLFFVGTNSQLWKSDESGTAPVPRGNDTASSSNTTDPFLAGSYLTIGGTSYFSANDGVSGYELWKTDGTAVGTVLVKDINSNPASGRSSPKHPPTCSPTPECRASWWNASPVAATASPVSTRRG